MFIWIVENFATILISSILLLSLCVAIRKIIKDKKSGKSGCGCGCNGCALSDKCHPDKTEEE